MGFIAGLRLEVEPLGSRSMPARFSVRQIDHVELYVPDRATAADWYEHVLGLKRLTKTAAWADDPHGPLMISPDGGRTMVALFTGPPQGSAEPIGLCRLAFRVDGAGFLEFIASTEVEVKDHEVAFSAYFTDPWGNPLEVTTYDHQPVRQALTA